MFHFSSKFPAFFSLDLFELKDSKPLADVLQNKVYIYAIC